MPLPDAVGTVTIAYDIRHPAGGAPGTGTVEVTIPYALRDSTDNVIIAPGTIVGTVTAGIGTVVIPDPNDPQISPQAWAPHIKVMTDVWAAEFDIVIPEGSEGTTVQLADLAPASSPPALIAYALAGHTHSGGGGGGDVPDATTTTKGILRLAGDLGGTATTPTVPGLAGKYVKPGSGIPASDLAAAVQTSLGKADTAVQPGALAAVATSGAYADLSGKPSIPDSYDDLTGTVPTSALPTLAINEVFTVASQAAMLALTAQRGDVAIRTDVSATFILASDSPGTLADWKQLAIPADAVLSVNGQTGIVVLAKADIGLGNVSNLAPADLPVSTATQTALDAKQASDSDLTTIAGLSPSADDLLQRVAGAWAARTPAQVKTSLALAKGDVGLGSVDNTSDADKPVSTAQQTAINARIPASTVNAKGDLLVGSADDTVGRLAVGSNGQIPYADSTQTLGIRWDAPPSGGGGASLNHTAARYGCKAITMNPHNLGVGTGSGGLKFIAMASGRLYQMRVALPAGEAVSSVRVPIKALGSGAGSLWVGVYQADLSPLGSSANVASAFTAGAAETWRTVSLSVPADSTGDFVWIVALSTLDTGPQLVFSEIDNANEFAWLLNTSGTPNAVRTEGASALPGTLAPGSGTSYLDCLLGVA